MRKVILIVGLILLVQPRLFAQISYLQSASSVSFTSATGVSVSFTSNTTLGNTIVVAASTAGPAISSVADTQGNTYVQAVASGSNAIWYATSIKGGADTITANFAASTGFSLIYVHEYAGLATSPLDQVSSQTGTGTAVTSGAKTTTQANELIFGYASVDHCVLSGSTGFSARQTAGCNMSEDMIVSATGTYAATFTQNVSSGWAGLMATFKAAASGSAPGYVQSASSVFNTKRDRCIGVVYKQHNTGQYDRGGGQHSGSGHQLRRGYAGEYLCAGGGFGIQCHLVRHQHQGWSGHGHGQFCSEHGIQSDLRSRVCGTGHESAGPSLVADGDGDGGNFGGQDDHAGQ